MSIYDTSVMLAALQQTPRLSTFLRDRYFPTSTARDVFSTKKVLIDVKKGTKKIAPIVAPRVGGVTVLREGYSTLEIEPAKVALQIPLTIDDLESRGFGEALGGQLTPAQRSANFLAEDLKKLDTMITGTEEVMCAQMLQTNGVVMKQYGDDGKEVGEFELTFKSQSGNDATLYTPSKKWNETGANKVADFQAMVRILVENGNPVTDAVISQDVFDDLMKDEAFIKLLDNRRIEVANIEPTLLANGISLVGKINVMGHLLNVIVYSETYEDESGQTQKYLQDGTVIITAPGCGKLLYGAVTQLEDDKAFHTYASMRVPKHLSDDRNNVRETRLTAKPLPIPSTIVPWVHAKVL